MTQLDLQQKLEKLESDLEHEIKLKEQYINYWIEESERVSSLEKDRDALQQQVNALAADKERMDYLVGKVVNVRAPLPYGSHNIFWSQCISDDSDPIYETDFREQIDAQLRQPEEKDHE